MCCISTLRDLFYVLICPYHINVPVVSTSSNATVSMRIVVIKFIGNFVHGCGKMLAAL